MKTDIHPKYFEQAKVTCACGAEFTVGSSMNELNIEICSQCHPLFTGQEKVMDTAGRMEKFKARVAATAAKSAAKKTTKK
jgi:large subunit ribosomal protein L31